MFVLKVVLRRPPIYCATLLDNFNVNCCIFKTVQTFMLCPFALFAYNETISNHLAITEVQYATCTVSYFHQLSLKAK